MPPGLRVAAEASRSSVAALVGSLLPSVRRKLSEFRRLLPAAATATSTPGRASLPQRPAACVCDHIPSCGFRARNSRLPSLVPTRGQGCAASHGEGKYASLDDATGDQNADGGKEDFNTRDE